jgi:hypothetical protein
MDKNPNQFSEVEGQLFLLGLWRWRCVCSVGTLRLQKCFEKFLKCLCSAIFNRRPKESLVLGRAYGWDNLSRAALGAHVAEGFFSIQDAIKHLNKRQQLGWVCFLTRLLGEVSPITS